MLPTVTGDKSVLIVDGDASQRQDLAVRLEILGFTVHHAETEEEALRALLKNPGLVVTEWNVWPQGGTAWLQTLASQVSQVILFSSDPDAFKGEDCLRYVKARVEKKKRTNLLKQIIGLFSSQTVMETEAYEPARPEADEDSYSGKHILVIEDSASIRGYLRRALELSFPDYRIREAEEGRIALDAINHYNIKMIITDLQMPGMDGETFLQHLQKMPEQSEKPVIVLSAKIPTYLIQMLKSRPNYRLMFKPAPAEKVVQAAMDLMARVG